MKSFISLIVILACGLTMPSFQNIDGYEALNGAFNDSGLIYNMGTVTGWVEREGEYKEKQEMKLMADDIYNVLSGNVEVNGEVLDDTGNGIVIKADIEGRIIMVSINNGYVSETGKYYQTVSVEITQQDEKENIIDIRRRLEDCLKVYDADPHINICISGYISGKADQDKRHSIINSIMNKLSAENIDKMEDRGIISVTGYSPFISDYIACSINKVNINIACRYSSYDDKTFFLLGTPIISSEY